MNYDAKASVAERNKNLIEFTAEQYLRNKISVQKQQSPQKRNFIASSEEQNVTPKLQLRGLKKEKNSLTSQKLNSTKKPISPQKIRLQVDSKRSTPKPKAKVETLRNDFQRLDVRCDDRVSSQTPHNCEDSGHGYRQVLLDQLKHRAAVLLHFSRLSLQLANPDKPTISAKHMEYITNNPDGIEEKFEQNPLLSTPELKALVKKIHLNKSNYERKAFVSISPHKAPWNDKFELFVWFYFRGIGRAILAMKSIFQKIALESNRPLIPTELVKRSPCAGSYKTPTKPKHGKGLNFDDLFAWSSFQGSPDPKKLPPPRLLRTSKDDDKSETEPAVLSGRKIKILHKDTSNNAE